MIVSMSEFTKHEQALLNMVMMIIEKDPSIEFDRDLHDNFFLESDEFHAILQERRNYEYNNACFKVLKEFVTKSSQSEF